MEITWLGHACARVRTRHATVLMDPFDRSEGLDMGRPTADIVTVSHYTPLHGHVAGVRGQPLVIDGPGEYEVQGVQITGVATSLRTKTAAGKPERNTAFLIEAEGLRVAQLGGIGVPPTAEEAEVLSNADVLILPIGEGALAPDDAARTLRMLEPSIAIPVSYQPNGMQEGDLKSFLTAVGIEPEAPVSKLAIQHRPGDGQKIVLLEPRG